MNVQWESPNWILRSALNSLVPLNWLNSYLFLTWRCGWASWLQACHRANITGTWPNVTRLTKVWAAHISQRELHLCFGMIGVAVFTLTAGTSPKVNECSRKAGFIENLSQLFIHISIYFQVIVAIKNQLCSKNVFSFSFMRWSVNTVFIWYVFPSLKRMSIAFQQTIIN